MLGRGLEDSVAKLHRARKKEVPFDSEQPTEGPLTLSKQDGKAAKEPEPLSK